MAHLKMIE